MSQYIRQWVEVGGIPYPERGYDEEFEDEEHGQEISSLFFLVGEIDAVLFDCPQLENSDYLRGWNSTRERIRKESEEMGEF